LSREGEIIEVLCSAIIDAAAVWSANIQYRAADPSALKLIREHYGMTVTTL
jgi:hypothetical protein